MSLRLSTWAVLLVCVGLAACRKPEVLEELPPSEALAIRAQAFNFHIYPGAQELDAHEELLKRAHFLMQPEAKEAPVIAVFEADATLETVVAFYSQHYGDVSAGEGVVRSQGDLATDAAGVKPLLDRLGIASDLSAVAGSYESVTFRGREGLPRVSLQRPYLDVFGGKVVNRTLIVMVRE